jgi:hypothetical protein
VLYLTPSQVRLLPDKNIVTYSDAVSAASKYRDRFIGKERIARAPICKGAITTNQGTVCGRSENIDVLFDGL